MARGRSARKLRKLGPKETWVSAIPSLIYGAFSQLKLARRTRTSPHNLEQPKHGQDMLALFLEIDVGGEDADGPP